MKNLKVRIVSLGFSLILMLFGLSAILEAGGVGGNQSGNTSRVAEPAAIVLLGAGLVSLGIYAKRKRKK